MYRPDASDKVAIFIDGENIHYSAKHLNMRLDYLKMCKALAGNRRLVRAYFYTAISNQSEGKIDFVNFLKLNGFKVVTKELKSFTEADTQQRFFKGNLDLDMAIDIYEMLPHLDTVIICSGDGDFVRLVESVSRQGKHVELCALREMTSTDLIAAADEYIDLDSVKDMIALDAPPPERNEDDPPQSRIRNELDDRIDYNAIEY
jgi:uncharacterized LabA/DUF88 family protein